MLRSLTFFKENDGAGLIPTMLSSPAQKVWKINGMLISYQHKVHYKSHV